MTSDFYFNSIFFKRFFRQLQIIFPKFCCSSTFLFFALLCIVIIEQVAVYFVGLVPSYYYKILGEKDLQEFWRRSGISLSLVLAMAVILSTKKFVWTQFFIKSREMLTNLLHHLYMSNINFYKLNIFNCNVDNVDQRITQDVTKMCHIFGEIIPNLLVTPFNILYYSYAAWGVTGYIGPLSVYVFFVVSTTLNKFLMSPIVACTAQQEQLEGEFRYKHTQLRLNSESAAFYRCGSTENAKLDEKFNSLITAQKQLNSKQFFLSLSVTSASYFGSILSYIIIAIPIFNGAYNDMTSTELSSIISRASFLILYLIYNFTRLIEMAPDVANMAGCSHRIGQLLEELWYLEGDNKKGDMIVTVDNEDKFSEMGKFGIAAYTLNRVNITVAHKASNYRLLCKDLNLEISTGCNLIITGDSGIGKTSLLRTLDGLWPILTGSINCTLPRGHSGIFYLPQRPYLTNGSLKHQIIFPDLKCNMDQDNELITNLRIASLDELLSRAGSLDAPLDWHWEDILSPGESQRLAFVRLFYHKPVVAFLDEATSQISEELECVLYKHCIELGMTLVSIGHRKTLIKYHNQELKLLSGGNWSLIWHNQGRGQDLDGSNRVDLNATRLEGYEGVEGDLSSQSNVDFLRGSSLGGERLNSLADSSETEDVEQNLLKDFNYHANTRL